MIGEAKMTHFVEWNEFAATAEILRLNKHWKPRVLLIPRNHKKSQCGRSTILLDVGSQRVQHVLEHASGAEAAQYLWKTTGKPLETSWKCLRAWCVQSGPHLLRCHWISKHLRLKGFAQHCTTGQPAQVVTSNLTPQLQYWSSKLRSCPPMSAWTNFTCLLACQDLLKNQEQTFEDILGLPKKWEYHPKLGKCFFLHLPDFQTNPFKWTSWSGSLSLLRDFSS